MHGPGEYRPDPSEGITAPADLPPTLTAVGLQPPPICPRPSSSPTVVTTSATRVRGVGTRPIGTSKLIARCMTWAISTGGVRGSWSSRIRSITVRSVASTSTPTSRI